MEIRNSTSPIKNRVGRGRSAIFIHVPSAKGEEYAKQRDKPRADDRGGFAEDVIQAEELAPIFSRESPFAEQTQSKVKWHKKPRRYAASALWGVKFPFSSKFLPFSSKNLASFKKKV